MKLFILLFLGASTAISAFAPPLQRSSSSTQRLSMASSSVVVVSPPGGVGEVAAVKAACLGSSVKWFVVSASEQEESVSLSSSSLQQVQAANGSLELAGASVFELSEDGSDDALKAISTWCGTSNDALICCYDGCEDLLTPDGMNVHQAALRRAVQQACSRNAISGTKVVLLPADVEVTAGRSDDGDHDKDGGFFGGMFGGKEDSVPDSLVGAVSSSSSATCTTLRYGSLFGIPESSPEFSPLVGGVRRDPILAEEYTMRNVRMDPYLFSNSLMSQLKTCRQAVGEAAALFATQTLKETPSQPITVASQLGTEEFTLEQWQAELERLQKQLAAGITATLYFQEMVVSDVERFTEWLASKWAPTVLRTYDIAAIRIGARPVYSNKISTNQVEIVWQELIKFETVTVGKMLLEVTETGVSATRVGGDSSKGYGGVSMVPLNGEDVLVRRLTEGAAQAVDKGLAKKAKVKKAKIAQPIAVAPQTSIQSSGTVPAAPKEEVASSSSASGPRTAGARRSKQRKRGGDN